MSWDRNLLVYLETADLAPDCDRGCDGYNPLLVGMVDSSDPSHCWFDTSIGFNGLFHHSAVYWVV